jgi:hypothetical protein
LEQKGGLSESSMGVEFERAVYLFKGNWAATIGDFFAENCRHQCMGQVSFGQHEYVLHRFRFVTLWVGVLGPFQRECVSNSNRSQQLPPIAIAFKTTFFKRSDHSGVNTFLQLPVREQEFDIVPIRERGIHYHPSGFITEWLHCQSVVHGGKGMGKKRAINVNRLKPKAINVNRLKPRAINVNRLKSKKNEGLTLIAKY